MGVFILFLTIAIKLSLAEIYDLYAPDDYINYNRNDELHHMYIEETDPNDSKIKYNEILSLLHNENSNKALMADISIPSAVNDSKGLRKDKYNTSENVIVKEDTTANNQKLKHNTRLAIKGWSRLRRNNENSDKAIMKDIPKLTNGYSNKLEEVDDKSSSKVTVKRNQDFENITGLLIKYLNGLNQEDNKDKANVKHISMLTTGDSNKLERVDDKSSGKVTVKRDQDFQNITGLLTKDLNGLNKENNKEKASMKHIPKLTTSDSNILKGDNDKKSVKVTVKHDQDRKVITGLPTKDVNGLNKEDNIDKAKVTGDVNNVRSKRHSALKLLNNLFHHTTAVTPSKSILPLNVRSTHNVTQNSSFTDMIKNLTESIKVLNENLANLKLHVNEKVEFLMIKVPIKEIAGKRYLKSIHKVEEKNENRSNNDHVRSKRDADAVNSDNINNNSTLEEDKTNFNITEKDNSIVDTKENVEPTIISDSETVDKLNELTKSKRDANITNTETNIVSSNDSIVNVTENSNHHINSRRSNIDEAIIKTEANESNNTKRNSESEISNTTNQLDKKLKEKTRKFLGNRDDLIFFIENTHRDIKNLITPMDGIRYKYSSTILYKIGYIIANLDTMDLTLKKLKNRIVKNSSDTKRLHQVLKKLNMSKKLVKNVMEYLNKYAVNQFNN